MDDEKKRQDGTVYYKGKGYPANPSVMDQMGESFQTTDDRAQLEAIRRARASAYANGTAR